MLRSIILFLLFSSSTQLFGQFTGEVDVCRDDCQTYQYDDGSGHNFFWQVDSGIANTNEGNEITICWDETGTFTISILDPIVDLNNPIHQEQVKVQDLPRALIIPATVPNCIEVDSTQEDGNDIPVPNCISACKGSTLRYFHPNSTDVNYEWLVNNVKNSNTDPTGIEVEWADQGQGLLFLRATSDEGCVDSSQVCVEFLENPNSSIGLRLGQDPNALCLNQTLYLEAFSDHGIRYEWLTSDGQAAEGDVAEFSFSSPGLHTLYLISETECACQDTSALLIDVQALQGPTITCLGPVCSGEEATYYALETCDTYNWQISSEGVILEGGGASDNYVTVQWQSGQEGTISLDVSNCNEIICPTPTIVPIGIIPSTVLIDGPTEDCRTGAASFSVPLYEGASYQWNLVGNGWIIDGYGTNAIDVLWDEVPWSPDTARIEVIITHCYLECESSGLIDVDLKREFVVGGNFRECEGNSSGFWASDGWNTSLAEWYVISPDGTESLVASGVSNMNTVLNDGPGNYVIKAIDNTGNYCNSEATLQVEVIALPDPVLEIEGPQLVCQGQLSTYYTEPVNLPLQLEWTISDGGANHSYIGYEISHLWTSTGPYSIEVVTNDIENYCNSSATFMVEPLSTGVIEGSETSCIDAIDTFSIEGPAWLIDEWFITPANAGTIQDFGDGSIAVHWHEDGLHSVTAQVCGSHLKIDVDIISNDLSLGSLDDGICPGDTKTISIPPIPDTDISVYNEDDLLVSSSFTFDVGPGFYYIELINANGCKAIETFYIEAYPEPIVNISSDEWGELCDPDGLVVIEAYVSNGGNDYQWFKDGAPIGFNNVRLMGAGPGTYQVLVTNSFGCQAYSPPVVAQCQESQCECRPDGGTYFTYTQGSCCNEYSFTNQSFSYVPGSLSYDFGDPQSGAANYTQDENPTHIFSHPGHFVVSLSGTVPHATQPGQFCGARYVDFITVPASADFEYDIACTNEGMQFTELCNYLYEYTITDYNWNFGDPASGTANTSNDQNPIHNYTTPGIYDVELIITVDAGCQAKITKQVEVQEAPNLLIELPASACIEEGLGFSVLGDDLLQVDWDFGDPSSGSANNSQNPTPIHAFDASGNYTISVTGKNKYGCTASTMVSLDVNDQSLTGDIGLDKNLPICYGDSVQLTAPTGGIAYFWSTGETTPSITVKETGLYHVTVNSADNCDYQPDPIVVTVDKPIDPIIVGLEEVEGTYYNEEHYGSMRLCQGKRFAMRTNYIWGATYEWSITTADSYYLSYNNFSSLTPGVYQITVKVNDPGSGCIIESSPFELEIYPLPDAISIASDNPDQCDGEVHTITVQNVLPGVRYFWNTGEEGTSITTSTPGSYYVTGINEFGCRRNSNWFSIYEKPSTDGFLTGCKEVCFPDTLCVSATAGVSEVSWVKDGIVTGIVGYQFIATDPGDYQVILTNWYGCKDTTDILNLSAKSADQSIRGMVFMDENQDGMFDPGDTPLTGVPVHVMQGNTSLEMIMTSGSGEYIFDPAPSSTGDIQIDTTGLGLRTNSPIRQSFSMQNCIEDTELHFPLIDKCQTVSESLTQLFSCPGEWVSFQGQDYLPGDIDSIPLATIDGCDSLIRIEVLPYELPEATLAVTQACQSAMNGSLDITSPNMSGIMYSLDGGVFMANTSYSNLSLGTHSLVLLSPDGCETLYNFDILAVPEPVFSVNTINSCFAMDNGSIEIITSELGLSFSINGSGMWSTNLTYDNLDEGQHTLFCLDSYGCEYQTPFFINEYPDISVDIDITSSCTDQDNGTLSISNLSSPTLIFAVDQNVTFLPAIFWDNIGVGTHTLFIKDEYGCEISMPFVIDEIPVPTVDILTEASCLDLANGAISIQTSDAGLMYSLDGINYDPTPSFTDLAIGAHTLYVQYDMCEMTLPFLIDEIPAVVIDISTEASCEGIDNGTLLIDPAGNNGLQFSLDGLNYSNNNTFDNLPIGTHTLYILTADGCNQELSFSIDSFTPPSLSSDVMGSCESMDNGLVTIEGAGNDVIYSIDGLTFQDSNIFEDLSPGSHTISIAFENGCSSEITVEIPVLAGIEAIFLDPETDCSTQSIVLEPQVLASAGSTSFDWSTGESSESITVLETGTYTVTISDECESREYSYDVDLSESEHNTSIYMPNVFSRDSDPINGIFKPLTPRGMDVLSWDFRVYDRWGNLMFETDDPIRGWDGYFNDDIVNPGVFVWLYTIEIMACEEPITLFDKGDVTLLK